jgi:hypothetical protein
MGGIITKKMLLDSSEHNAPELKSIFDDTAGILFLRTPHAGSGHADFGSFFATLLELFRRDVNTSPVEDLKIHNPSLQEAERRFTQLLAKRKESGDAIDVRCFYEGRAMNAVTGLVGCIHVHRLIQSY